MGFFRRFSPAAAYRDLRGFLASRERYELGFLALAIGITTALIFAFVGDAQVEPEYVPHITYVQQWRADRTDAEIKAQQVIDQAAREKQAALDKAERAKSQAEFKRLDDKLKRMGI